MPQNHETTKPCKRCSEPAFRLSRCRAHYDELLLERMMDRVAIDPETGCWLWGAGRTRLGYGKVGRAGVTSMAHRVMYELVTGAPIGRGLALDHLCQNPPCVNPAHLEPVTHRENIRRAYAEMTPDPPRKDPSRPAVPGTMRERAPGVWQLRVSVGISAVTGQRRVVTETFKGSRSAAAARLAEFYVREKDARAPRGDASVRATIDAWRARAGHAPGTARNYDLAVRAMPAHFMRSPIGKLRADAIEELEQRVAAEHGVHRARLVHAVVSGALTFAWRQEWINGNPARRVQPPTAPRGRSTSPSRADVRRLLEVVEGSPELHLWLLLSVMAGSRRSEILALRWSDVDLVHGAVSIDKAIDPVVGGVKSTKTNRRRTVAVGPLVVAAFERWRVAFGERAVAVGLVPARDPYVFAGDLGGSIPWRPDLATRRFDKLRTKAGVTCRLHDLRHHMATELLAAGVPAKVVAARVGHTRVATTTDLYGHALPASDREAADVMERGL